MASERPVRELASYLAPEDKRPAWGILGLKQLHPPENRLRGMRENAARWSQLFRRRGFISFRYQQRPSSKEEGRAESLPVRFYSGMNDSHACYLKSGGAAALHPTTHTQVTCS